MLLFLKGGQSHVLIQIEKLFLIWVSEISHNTGIPLGFHYMKDWSKTTIQIILPFVAFANFTLLNYICGGTIRTGSLSYLRFLSLIILCMTESQQTINVAKHQRKLFTGTKQNKKENTAIASGFNHVLPDIHAAMVRDLRSGSPPGYN